MNYKEKPELSLFTEVRFVARCVVFGILLQCGAWFLAALLIATDYSSLAYAKDLLFESPLIALFLAGFIPYALAIWRLLVILKSGKENQL